MYDWLGEALQNDATVVTANRRLARVLRQHFNQQQLGAGHQAWAAPSIDSWKDWLLRALRSADNQAALPTLINQHHSQLLWERCLAKELPDVGQSIHGLVRLAQEAWQRLADWQVSIQEVARSAQSDDQRLFARVAGRYLAVLEHENWMDEAGVAALLQEKILAGHVKVSGVYTFAGFDRPRPIESALHDAISAMGGTVQKAPTPAISPSIALQSFETADAEMRAAGAWARARLEEDFDQNIAIIGSNLSQQAERKARLVREGLVPGWQYAQDKLQQAVNVSYGRALADYPAVAIALLLLRWLVKDLSSAEVGQLLRSPLLGNTDLGDRSRMELRLRRLPERHWSPDMLARAFRQTSTSEDSDDWARILSNLVERRRQSPLRDSPAAWAAFFNATLQDMMWPGTGTLNSLDFQLVNRWRDLLNDLARLDLVSPSMSRDVALQRLRLMAAETVFQPESEFALVQLLGPLEASGAQFDAIWISGVTAANWPPSAAPSPLLSRRLQRSKGMPDADPADSLAYADTTLHNLSCAAPSVVYSYPETDDDAEQTPSYLLEKFATQSAGIFADPGWHATTFARNNTLTVVDDPVPALRAEETVGGGANTLQLALSDPLAAFIRGRLGVMYLQPQASGIPAWLRGNIIHDALHRLYAERPSRSELATWFEEDLDERISRAVAKAIGRQQRHVDSVLHELLALEQQRLRHLLLALVAADIAREDFVVDSVERELKFCEDGVAMTLRTDRIDRLPDNSIVILDYKTGARRPFLTGGGEPRGIQLVAYACALEDQVAALALVNVDSREIVFDGAGRGYKKSENWAQTLEEWQRLVHVACTALRVGDVRLNGLQGVTEARPLNLLSRYTELSREQ